MNGIIILVCSLLLLMAIKLLIERNFIGLILFCVVLFLAFGVTPQGECYNPKKAIFDRATEEVNKQLKRQMILYKRRIKELELQIELLEEENQRLKENR